MEALRVFWLKGTKVNTQEHYLIDKGQMGIGIRLSIYSNYKPRHWNIREAHLGSVSTLGYHESETNVESLWGSVNGS